MEEQTTTATRTRPQVQKPRLEIPDPTKLAGNASSPRSMHGFPQSPQSPYSVSPAASGDVKSFEEWSSSVAAVTNCQDDSSSSAAASAAAESDGVEKKRLLHFYVGELVLVRCNQSKWLLGQVRRSSKTGVIVWVGVAQTLVNVPYDLLASHLVKLDNPSQPASPSSTVSAGALEVNRSGQLMAPFQCVRPAHLSHRKLYQTLQPAEGRNKVHHPNSAQTGMVINQQSSREIFLGSSSLPNLQIIQGFKTEASYGNQARTSAQRSYALCRFKFPEQQENEDDSFMNRFGRATELYPDRNAKSFDEGNKSEWITVIENGMDIRKKC